MIDQLVSWDRIIGSSPLHGNLRSGARMNFEQEEYQPGRDQRFSERSQGAGEANGLSHRYPDAQDQHVKTRELCIY